MAFHPLAAAIATYSPNWLVTLRIFLSVADGMKMARTARMPIPTKSPGHSDLMAPKIPT
jgi:hypothetical protein